MTARVEPSVVYLARAPIAEYGRVADASLPELGEAAPVSTACVTFRSLLRESRWDGQRFGTSEWNPLGAVIPPGSRVVIKPNWVHHWNASGRGMDCLVTHTSVLEAVLAYVLKTAPRWVVIGDAPIQGCDFAAMRRLCGTDVLEQRAANAGVEFAVKDYRRTVLPGGALASRKLEDRRSLDNYVLFDLGAHSALEAITTARGDFRVTMYDPDRLSRTHAPGRHQYLVARDFVEADVVINVPKLKTHKKACITGALKNVVGINGHKEYLPHHRKGGSVDGGDCYPGRDRVKAIVEDLLDAVNRTDRPVRKQVLAAAVRGSAAISRILGGDGNYDGSWHGNDTVWRTCLDLQRILHYGEADGTLAKNVQRTVLTITDAIIAGEGEGPLSPTPVPLGIMTMGVNTAAVEWLHALLMGFDPRLIPLTREAFAPHDFPLVDFDPTRIVVKVDEKQASLEESAARYGRAFRPPAGWKGHCER